MWYRANYFYSANRKTLVSPDKEIKKILKKHKTELLNEGLEGIEALV